MRRDSNSNVKVGFVGLGIVGDTHRRHELDQPPSWQVGIAAFIEDMANAQVREP